MLYCRKYPVPYSVQPSAQSCAPSEPRCTMVRVVYRRPPPCQAGKNRRRDWIIRYAVEFHRGITFGYSISGRCRPREGHRRPTNQTIDLECNESKAPFRPERAKAEGRSPRQSSPPAGADGPPPRGNVSKLGDASPARPIATRLVVSSSLANSACFRPLHSAAL